MIKFWLAKHVADFVSTVVELVIGCAVILLVAVILTIRDKRKEKKDAADKKDR